MQLRSCFFGLSGVIFAEGFLEMLRVRSVFVADGCVHLGSYEPACAVNRNTRSFLVGCAGPGAGPEYWLPAAKRCVFFGQCLVFDNPYQAVMRGAKSKQDAGQHASHIIIYTYTFCICIVYVLLYIYVMTAAGIAR